VTQGAVSRQIRHLEADLGQALFHRDGPRLALTDAGELLFEAASEALAILRRSTSQLKHLSSSPTLTISVLPSFAAKWLVQRIPDFSATHSDIELRLAASYEVVDFRQQPDVDLAIRFGAGGWDGVFSECLFNERVFPVCSPHFLQVHRGLSRPSDLNRVPLLYADQEYDQWPEWFEAANVEPPPTGTATRYSDMSMLLYAAASGQGVALARSLSAANDLETKLLVRPFDLSIRSRYSYYFVCPEGRVDDARVTQFLHWIRSEAQKTDSACNLS
jgi:LysR family glycine cleavage system transcriptional activator